MDRFIGSNIAFCWLFFFCLLSFRFVFLLLRVYLLRWQFSMETCIYWYLWTYENRSTQKMLFFTYTYVDYSIHCVREHIQFKFYWILSYEIEFSGLFFNLLLSIKQILKLYFDGRMAEHEQRSKWQNRKITMCERFWKH